MRRRIRPLIVFACALAGCATTADRGWTGSGAQPFDQAIAECKTAVPAPLNTHEGKVALERCMAGKGWTRP
jgi:hypothetical protein